MIKIGNTYDENSVSAKNDMTGAWQKRHNPAKSSDKQFGKSYDGKKVRYTYLEIQKYSIIFIKLLTTVWHWYEQAQQSSLG